VKKVYLISAVMALVVGIAVYAFASSLEQKARPVNIETQTVVTAVLDIPENTLVTEDMVTMQSLPVQAVHPSAVTDPSQVIGQITKYPIMASEQVLLSRLGEQGEGAETLSFKLEEGYRALTVAVDEVTGVAGYIEAGDHVDMIATLIYPTNEGEVSYAVSTMLCENLLVLKTGLKTIGSTDSASALYSSVTLSVTPDDALKINYAASNGRLRFVLRPVLDGTIVKPADFPPFEQKPVQSQDTAE
jgi:pilus assembly protein CpaB